VDDDSVGGEVLGDGTSGGLNTRHVGLCAPSDAGRVDGDEDEFCPATAHGIVGGEVEAPGQRDTLEHVLQPGLINGDLAAVELSDLLRVDAQANDIVPQTGETGSGHQPSIPRPDHTNLRLL